MMAVRPRTDPVRIFWKRLLLLGLLILVCLSAWAVWGVFQKERESRILRLQAELKLSDAENRHERLTVDIGALETARGKEEALRGAYQVGKKGEGVIIIVDRTPTTTEAATSTPFEWIRERLRWW